MFAKNNTAIDGLAVHWYDGKNNYDVLTRIHNEFPDRMILSSEASNSYWNMPALGNWDFAQRYAHDIIQDLKNWVVGWVRASNKL